MTPVQHGSRPCRFSRATDPASLRQTARRRKRQQQHLFCPAVAPACGKAPGRTVMTTEQQRFAVTHLNLARQQARRFACRHGMAYEEVLGAAYEGLCKAAIGFDPARGHRPSSYVVPKVKGELLHHLRDTGFALHISHRLRELWMKARQPVAQGLADTEIAALLQVPLELWLECRQVCGLRPLSLEGELERELDGSGAGTQPQ